MSIYDSTKRYYSCSFLYLTFFRMLFSVIVRFKFRIISFIVDVGF